MPKMFSKGFKPKSTTKKAKSIIRNEMLSYFPAREYGTKTRLDAMKRDAEAVGIYPKYASDYTKGKALVNAGCCACYYDDQRKMLSKIYGKKNVDNWDGQKVHNTYGNLIGREYASMLREKKKAKRS